MKRKKIMTAVSVFLLALLYLMIFGFSNQTGEESGSLSLYISEKCAELLNSLAGKHWTKEVLDSIALYFEHPLRKMAHFVEYAVMGILVYGVWSPWISRQRLYFLVVLWIFISAAADEVHQFFVPGRYCSFADVLLDTAGGYAGILLCVLMGRVYLKYVRRRNNGTDLCKKK